jgi:acyl-CoA synthetase (AMP-forming)/AMP-acid ligase II
MRTNLGLFLAKRAQLSSSIEALVELERGRRFTFAELDSRANRAAHALLARGVRPGDRVALLLMNGVEYLESYFGAAKLGAVVVPLNWRLVPEELAFILRDSGTSVLVHDGEFDDGVAALRSRDQPVRHWLRAGDAASCPEWAEAWDAAVQGAPSEAPPVGAGDEDLLFIMYTSGTTGLPKGAAHTHASMAAASITVNMTAEMRFRDRYLQMLPLFHVGALTPATASVHRGATLVLMRAFDPHRAWEAIEAERVTTGLAVPAMLNFMWGSPRRESCDRSSLRWLMSGAAPVPVPLIERYASIGVEIHQVYGLTESCGPACLIGPEQAIAKAGSTGPAFFHTDVRVVNPGGGDVQPGEVGEVWIRGSHVMQGYWNRPEATAETIVDGWLRSGDLATVDEDGYVYIQDRKKDMIISGGENVYPAEVENVLAAHPKIQECAVIGMPSERWGESAAAVVALRPGESATAEEVLAFCQGKLARYKQPKVVEFVDAIPRNPSGKALKRLLRERFPGPAPE